MDAPALNEEELNEIYNWVRIHDIIGWYYSSISTKEAHSSWLCWWCTDGWSCQELRPPSSWIT